MWSLDEIRSNLSHLVYVLLRKVPFLYSGFLAMKMRKSLVLMENKAIGTCFKKEKRSYEVSRPRKASL